MALISIIIPVYNEEDNLLLIHERLSNALKNVTHNYEIIFVDDCSVDSSFQILKDISIVDNQIRVIRFSRNFGSHAGCLAGLMNANGDACAFLSADMQDPPEMIPRFIEKWEEGYEIVMGHREVEKGTINSLSKLYYMLVRKFALKNMPETGTDVFLVDRKVIEAITEMREKHTSIFGLLLWSGFNQTFLPYERQQRQKGVTKWTLGKKVKLFVDTFVSFSFFPIRLISYTGVIFAVLGFIYAAVIIANRLFFSKIIEGWASLMVVLLVVSGIQMLMLGVLGEYLWRSFDESRNRPPFIVSEKIGFDKEITIK